MVHPVLLVLIHAVDFDRLALAAESRTTEIVGGDDIDAGDWPDVVAVIAEGRLCTGTLIAPALILTAGHCVAGVEDLSRIDVFTGDAVDRGAPLQVVEAGFHPELCAGPDCGDAPFDFGYVRLAEQAVISPRPMVLTQGDWDAGLFVGADTLLVGYGASEAGVEVKRELETTISEVSVTGRSFGAGGDGKGACGGDSGGPALVRGSQGEWLLAGVSSSGSEPCGQWSEYGTAYAALEWLVDDVGFQPSVDCPGYDCVDTSPPKAEGCSFAAPSELGPTLSLLLVVLGSSRRRDVVAPHHPRARA